MEQSMPKGRRTLKTKHEHLKTSTYATFILLTLLFGFLFQCPLGDPCKHFRSIKEQYLALHTDQGKEYLCEAYKLFIEVLKKGLEMCQYLFRLFLDILYQLKIKIYKVLALLDPDDLCHYACFGTSEFKPMKKIRNKSSM
ncbi:PREDICTED: uncharacterized protein LOC106102703 [Papilio polytes]|uniref:uncharacterized protein LOC106102703 n=1 Tax=Papilio polytes TaxID=76194 RepID=UPI000676A3D9|nr:PREDICTED: uncharacterized protein LOC106102703 [Papilio polytes]